TSGKRSPSWTRILGSADSTSVSSSGALYTRRWAAMSEPPCSVATLWLKKPSRDWRHGLRASRVRLRLDTASHRHDLVNHRHETAENLGNCGEFPLLMDGCRASPFEPLWPVIRSIHKLPPISRPRRGRCVNRVGRRPRYPSKPGTSLMAKYVYFFGAGKAEGRADMKELLGGKGANLAEMTNIGLPVPAG